MALPRFAGFRSTTNGKYLSYITEDDKVIPNLLQYSSDELVTTRTKYALEPASNGESYLVHIRCCYNNKYWRAESSSSPWIAATASEPNETQSDWSCTLFKTTFDSESNGHEIMHVNRGERLVLFDQQADHPNCLYISNSYSSSTHTIIDWETLVMLPKYIVFKGDNGMYLQSHDQDYHEYLQYSSSDPASVTVGHEVFSVGDGNIRIKSKGWGKFWKASPTWVWACSTDTSNDDKYTLFKPVKVRNNVIALQNLGNNLYCRRLTADWKENCLNADQSTISNTCEIEIGEYAASRTIYNVLFRLSDSIIYGESIEIAATDETSNSTGGTINTELDLSYDDEVARTWSSTLELKLGFSLEFSAGIPLITSAGLKFAGSFTGSYTWGQTLTTKTHKVSKYKAVVLPNTRVRVNLITTKAHCDVPFSYTQRDVYDDGTVKIEERDDGLYTGLNCYNYYYEVEEEPID